MDHESLINKLFVIGAIKFGEFKLKSGIISPIYIDLRLTVSYPDLLKEVGVAMWEKVQNLPFTIMCGVPYTALPIATAISIEHNKPMVMRRKEVKDYGLKKTIEGKFEAGQNVLVIEDLVTSGLSVFETIEPLEHEGLKVTDIVVLIDREQGGKKHIQSKGYNLHSVLTISEILETLEQTGKIEVAMADQVRTFIKENQI